jgi:hypothetical protein
MSLIKKSDVKNHLSARHHNRIHLAPASQPDATGFSGTNQESAETSGSVLSQGFTGDHTTVVKTGALLDASSHSSKAQAPGTRAAKV